MNKVILSLLTFILLTGCGPGGISQFERKILGKYIFDERGGDDKLIGYFSRNAFIKVVDRTIIQYVNDDRYIIVLRQPSILRFQPDRTDTETLQKCEYWIIDSQTDEVEGPLSEDELKEKNKRIKISLDKLKIPISSYIRDHMNYCL